MSRKKAPRYTVQDDDKRRAALIRKRLGQALKAARKRRHLSHVALGTLVQSDSGNLSRLENGRQWIGDLMLVRLSRALEEPVWMLLAHAEGAVDEPLFELLETYQNSDEEGRALIKQAATVAKRHYQRERDVPQQAAAGGGRKHGANK